MQGGEDNRNPPPQRELGCPRQKESDSARHLPGFSFILVVATDACVGVLLHLFICLSVL